MFLNNLAQAVQYSYDYYNATDAAADAAAGSFFAATSLISCCIPLVIWGVFIIAAIWVYKDAQKNNVDNPILWAVVTFFLGIIGLVLYFVIAKNQNSGGTSTPPAPETKP